MANEIQNEIQSLLDTMVREGKEDGAQVAVYQHGKLIVDAWAGVADARTGRKFEGDTICPVFSTGKGIASTIVHILAERGRLDYDTPVARYWPEFAAEGKGNITVRHVLTHTAGLPNIPPGTPQEVICDWTAICAVLAAAKPETPAGEKMQYHPVTFGWLLGEVARRADGRPFPQLLAEEIAAPLGVKTMFMGVPAELEPSVAELKEICENGKPDSSIVGIPLADWMNRSDTRRACVPGANGIMNARAVARHYAALLPGGIDGVELLPPSRVALATQDHTSAKDRNDNPPRGLGYILGEGGIPTAFGHGGYGGSDGFADPVSNLAVGLCHNRFSPHDFVGQVLSRLRQLLGLV